MTIFMSLVPWEIIQGLGLLAVLTLFH
jgi:hypothetical protein